MCVPTHESLKYDIVKMATAMSAETLENWTFDLAYTRKPKLFTALNQRKPQTNVVFFKDLWVETDKLLGVTCQLFVSIYYDITHACINIPIYKTKSVAVYLGSYSLVECTTPSIPFFGLFLLDLFVSFTLSFFSFFISLIFPW